MAIAFRAAASATGNNQTCNKPAGVVSGDVLIALLYVDQNNQAVTPPAGWTSLENQNVSAGPYNHHIYYKVAGASEPSTYTFSNATSYTSIVIIAFSGVDNTTPIDNGGAAHAAQANASSTTDTVPSVTTATANAMLVAGLINYNGGTFSTLAGWTAAAGANTSDGLAIQYKSQAATGATGTFGFTISGASVNSGSLLALKPAGAGGTTNNTVSAGASLALKATGVTVSAGASLALFHTHADAGASVALKALGVTVSAAATLALKTTVVAVATTDQKSQTRFGRPLVRRSSDGVATLIITETAYDATQFGPPAHLYHSSDYQTWTQGVQVGTTNTVNLVKLSAQDSGGNAVVNPTLVIDPNNGDLLIVGANNQNDGLATHNYEDMVWAYAVASGAAWAAPTVTDEGQTWDDSPQWDAVVIPGTHNIWFAGPMLEPGTAWGSNTSNSDIMLLEYAGGETGSRQNTGQGGAGATVNGPVAPANTTVPMVTALAYTSGSPATVYLFFNDSQGVLRYVTWADGTGIPSGVHAASTSYASPAPTGTLAVRNEEFSIARDANDGLHVAVANGSGIFYAYKPLGGAWTSAVQLSSNASDSYPRVTLFGTARVLVTWTQATGTANKANVVYAWAAIASTPSFSAPLTIFADSSAGGVQYTNAEAVSEDGSSYLVTWMSGTAAPYTVNVAQVTPSFIATSSVAAGAAVALKALGATQSASAALALKATNLTASAGAHLALKAAGLTQSAAAHVALKQANLTANAGASFALKATNVTQAAATHLALKAANVQASAGAHLAVKAANLTASAAATLALSSLTTSSVSAGASLALKATGVTVSAGARVALKAANLSVASSAALALKAAGLSQSAAAHVALKASGLTVQAAATLALTGGAVSSVAAGARIALKATGVTVATHAALALKQTNLTQSAAAHLALKQAGLTQSAAAQLALSATRTQAASVALALKAAGITQAAGAHIALKAAGVTVAAHATLALLAPLPVGYRSPVGTTVRRSGLTATTVLRTELSGATVERAELIGSTVKE